MDRDIASFHFHDKRGSFACMGCHHTCLAPINN